MKINVAAVRKCLKAFDFTTLFREHLGWDKHQARLDVPVDGVAYALSAVAQKRGFVAYVCDSIPPRAVRLKIDHQVTKTTREHFVVYGDQAAGQQVWQWVRREPGQPLASRDHRLDVSQTGDPLIQRLEQLAIAVEEEEQLALPDVTGKVKKALNVDKITKKFYERFQSEHESFRKFVKGIKSDADLQWYTSLMLNRLMFVYFIQKKGFLDHDADYLRDRLQRVRAMKGQDKFHSFYRYFLLRLFQDGLGTAPGERDLEPDLEQLLGTVPYLNGGFFEVHELERRNEEIEIPDKAFEKLFAFFEEFRWHLDERPLRADNEINPDVVGYIFEKYINQKQMGAYYTKEDITEYISKNTIVPFLFDAAEKKCPIAFQPDSHLWRLLRDDPDRYLYDAVRHGVIDDAGEVTALPAEIEAGVADVAQRGGWNKPAAEPYGLPTETWREHVARRQRCLELREKLSRGEVHQVNDLITLNLDIWQFARDAIVQSEGPELLRAFWQAIEKVTVLDPTCGSGAFLFAALRILETLYGDCLERMRQFVDEAPQAQRPPAASATGGKRIEKFADFKEVLAQTAQHPSQRYFILKSIIINNLFGVDIMPEAVEICKLRLFLKLVAQVERAEQIEPLPDIDFNIRAGNTLVGYVTLEQIRQARESESAGGGAKQKLMLDSDAEAELARLEEDARSVEKAFDLFRAQQTAHGGRVTVQDKAALRDRLQALDGELDRYLAGEYGVEAGKKGDAFKKWKQAHQPFHWFVEFYGIMRAGGFDVIIGNPPYVSTTTISYLQAEAKSLKLPDLYAHVLLRSLAISSGAARYGMIVPLSITFSEQFEPLRRSVLATGKSWLSSYDNIPAALFGGVSQRCTIWIGGHSKPSVHVTPMYRWRSVGRPQLLANIAFSEIAGSASPVGVIPKLAGPSLQALGAVCNRECTTRYRRVLTRNRSAEHWIRFSPSARNFVSAFSAPPPCVNDLSLKPVASSDHGALAVEDERAVAAGVITIVGECFFHHWLTWGDGFHVTSGNVASFVQLLECIPEPHWNILTALGDALLSRQNEALVFKRNAGKYVGNYNYREHAFLTRRADLILIAGLGLRPDTALELFSYAQRVLAINEFAGEKSIPPALKSKYAALEPDTLTEAKVFKIADDTICDYFGFTRAELQFLLYADVATHCEVEEPQTASV